MVRWDNSLVIQGYNNWTNGLYGYSWDMMVHSWNTQHVRITYRIKETGKTGFLNPQVSKLLLVAVVAACGFWQLSWWCRSQCCHKPILQAFCLNNRWHSHGDMLKQHAACVEAILAREHNVTGIELYYDVWRSLNDRFQQRCVSSQYWVLYSRNDWLHRLCFHSNFKPLFVGMLCRQFDPRVDILTAEWSPTKQVSWIFPLLTDLSNWRGKLEEIQKNIYNSTNETDVVFVADFPGRDSVLAWHLSDFTLRWKAAVRYRLVVWKLDVCTVRENLTHAHIDNIAGLSLENYIQPEFGNTSLQVMKGQVVIELLGDRDGETVHVKNITLGEGDTSQVSDEDVILYARQGHTQLMQKRSMKTVWCLILQVAAGEYHNVHTISDQPSCYFYLFTNTTEQALSKNISLYEEQLKQTQEAGLNVWHFWGLYNINDATAFFAHQSSTACADLEACLYKPDSTIYPLNGYGIKAWLSVGRGMLLTSVQVVQN